MRRDHSLFYIWFTTNPADPLGKATNWERLQNWRRVHPAPKYNLTLVVSCELLNAEGMQRLETLKQNLAITIVDIHDIRATTPLEGRLLDFAKREVFAPTGEKIGHFAAASDILRCMRFLLGQFGIYSDMDGFLNLQLLEENALDTVQFYMPVNNACLWIKHLNHPAIEVFQQLQYCRLLLESPQSRQVRYGSQTDRYRLREAVAKLTGLVGLFDTADEEKNHIAMWNNYAKTMMWRSLGRKQLFHHEGDWIGRATLVFQDISICEDKIRLINCEGNKQFVDTMCDAITALDSQASLTEDEKESIKRSIFLHREAVSQYEYVLWFANFLKQRNGLSLDEAEMIKRRALEILTVPSRSRSFEEDDHNLRLFSAAATYLNALNSYCLEAIDVQHATQMLIERGTYSLGYPDPGLMIRLCQWTQLLMVQYPYANREQQPVITQALAQLLNARDFQDYASYHRCISEFIENPPRVVSMNSMRFFQDALSAEGEDCLSESSASCLIA